MSYWLRYRKAQAAAVEATIIKRRHLAVAAVVAESLEKTACGPQGPKVDAVKERFDWQAHVQKIKMRKFINKYRLDKEGFAELADLIRPDIVAEHPEMADRSSAGPIEPEVRIASTLRWLARGAYQDIEEIYRMSTSELSESFWTVTFAINRRVEVKLDLTDIEALKRLEVGFALKSRKHNWRGQVKSSSERDAHWG
jgi:hypothetical protein